MYQIEFYQEELPESIFIKYSIMISQYNGKWVVVRNKARQTWEIPGGHIEPGERPNDAAHRELQEETGAIVYRLKQVCYYSAQDDKEKTYGCLFYADIFEFGPLPNMEVAEVRLVDELPENLTYPTLQPHFFAKVKSILHL